MSARFSHSRTSPTVLFMSSVKARDFAVDNPLSKGDAMNIGFGFRSVAYSSGIQYGMDSVATSCSKEIEIRSCHWPVPVFW